MLQLRSLEAGECVISPAPFSIRQMATNVIAVCRMSLAHRAPTRIVWLREDAPLPVLVLGDADRLSQVLLNLLTSACTPHSHLRYID